MSSSIIEHRTMFTKKSGVSQALQLLLFLVAIHQATQKNCIKLKALSVRTTDTVNYRHQIILHNNNTVYVVGNVLKKVPIPSWNIQVLQSGEGFKKVHYIGNIKACEILSLIKKIRLLRELASPFFDSKNSNISLECPLQVGTYVANNVYIPPETSFLRFLYVPKSILTIKGVIRSLLPNNIKEKLATFDFNLTMYKTC